MYFVISGLISLQALMFLFDDQCQQIVFQHGDHRTVCYLQLPRKVRDTNLKKSKRVYVSIVTCRKRQKQKDSLIILELNFCINRWTSLFTCLEIAHIRAVHSQ